ncbi:MAG: LysM peptidoglycan-binding domain-containing protein [Treponema sp.]|nr:LysM peptidoglycan-binding domain-containing protein [Treponema sp.]
MPNRPLLPAPFSVPGAVLILPVILWLAGAPQPGAAENPAAQTDQTAALDIPDEAAEPAEGAAFPLTETVPPAEEPAIPAEPGAIPLTAAPPVEAAPAEAVLPAEPAPTARGRPLRQQIFPPPERIVRQAREDRSPAADRNPKIGPIPGLDQDLTLHYLAQYSSPAGLTWLRGVMERANPYLGFIRGEIEKRGLPMELLYLPVIESSYVPTAKSRSGAAGLWQFMQNSIAPFDMRVDDWVDERMDFWKSTQGALRKLEENYEMLGDWPLALAAYNSGLGGINQTIRRTGSRDYWELSRRKALRTETIHYVPKLLAAARILSEPRRYGLENWQESPEWTRVPLEKIVDLNLLARETGIDPVLLGRGNGELLLNISPPVSNYLLKVPAETAEQVKLVLAGTTELVDHYYHTIRSGDTLSALALHYGVSVSLIEQTNPGIKSTALQIGSRLKIPALNEVGPYLRRQEPEGNFGGIYVVKRGDTLWSIALEYGADLLDLARANDMELSGILREGRTLKVPIK